MIVNRKWYVISLSGEDGDNKDYRSILDGVTDKYFKWNLVKAG